MLDRRLVSHIARHRRDLARREPRRVCRGSKRLGRAGLGCGGGAVGVARGGVEGGGGPLAQPEHSARRARAPPSPFSAAGLAALETATASEVGVTLHEVGEPHA